MADNTVSIVGNATRSPELRFTPGGAGVASFGVAVNRRYQKNGEWVEDVSFFDVVAFGSLAENTAETVEKGMRVTVTGRLDQRTWDDKETGGKRSKVEIVADDVAPSLRWATAQVTRNPKTENGAPPTRNAGGGYNRAAATTGGGGGGYDGGGYSDEEPF